MLVKITLQFIVLIFSMGNVSVQWFEPTEKEAERILISLSDGDSIDGSKLTMLKKLLTTYVDTNYTESNLGVKQRSIDSLSNHLTEYESELRNIATDSAFVLFNDWYLHLQNIFYEHLKQKFFSSPKQKVLFFSTSMSCYCTLKMSREQTVELLKFIAKNTDKYDYWVIDSYWYNDLQIKYETLFAPSVIVFDGNNKVIYRIEYEEKMLSLLEKFLSNEKN